MLEGAEDWGTTALSLCSPLPAPLCLLLTGLLPPAPQMFLPPPFPRSPDVLSRGSSGHGRSTAVALWLWAAEGGGGEGRWGCGILGGLGDLRRGDLGRMGLWRSYDALILLVFAIISIFALHCTHPSAPQLILNHT